jgi:hypothetical protein
LQRSVSSHYQPWHSSALTLAFAIFLQLSTLAGSAFAFALLAGLGFGSHNEQSSTGTQQRGRIHPITVY